MISLRHTDCTVVEDEIQFLLAGLSDRESKMELIQTLSQVEFSGHGMRDRFLNFFRLPILLLHSVYTLLRCLLRQKWRFYWRAKRLLNRRRALSSHQQVDSSTPVWRDSIEFIDSECSLSPQKQICHPSPWAPLFLLSLFSKIIPHKQWADCLIILVLLYSRKDAPVKSLLSSNWDFVSVPASSHESKNYSFSWRVVFLVWCSTMGFSLKYILYFIQ